MRRTQLSKPTIFLIAIAVVAVFIGIVAVITGDDEADDPSATEEPIESVSPTPVATPLPSVEPSTFDPEVGAETEDTTPGAMASGAVTYPHENSGGLSCQLYNGGTLTVGAASDEGGRLILDPSFTEGEAGQQYAIYVMSTNIPVIYADNDGQTRDSAKNSGVESLLVLDRTYDTLVPASTGVYWEYSSLLSADPSTGSTLCFRVIRLNDNLVMGGAQCRVVFDTADQCFRLSDLQSSDVSVSGALSQEQRADLVQRAISFIQDPDVGPRLSDDFLDYWGDSESRAFVEKTPKLYFSQLMGQKQELIRAGSYMNRDIYAVSVPCPALGFVTVYFMPQEQINGLLAVPDLTGDNNVVLEILGYDFLMPYSKDMLQSAVY